MLLRPIRALVFDIGQVIVRVEPIRTSLALAGNTHTDAEELLRRVASGSRLRDFQEGRLSPRDWHGYLTKLTGIVNSFEAFCEIWNRALDRRPILPNHLFEQLGSRCRLVLLSNTDPIHVACLENEFTFLRYFPARIYSCTAGTSKPQPPIYQRASDAAGAPPEAILYVDDVPEYIEAGRRAGMQTHLFCDEASLLAELKERKLLA